MRDAASRKLVPGPIRRVFASILPAFVVALAMVGGSVTVTSAAQSTEAATNSDDAADSTTDGQSDPSGAPAANDKNSGSDDGSPSSDAAQPESDETKEPPGATDKSSAADDGPFLTPFEIKEDERQLSAMEHVDSAFGAAVGYMQTVLFFRLGRRQEEFIQFAVSRYFVRPRDSDESFVLLDPLGKPTSTTLDQKALDLWTLRGKLELDELKLGKPVAGGAGNVVRLGTLPPPPGSDKGEEVEYVAAQVNNSTYVLTEGEYLKVRPVRELLDSDERLTEQQVEAASRRGELQLVGDLESAGDPQRPFLLTRYTGGIPIVVLWLAAGAVIFTLYMGFYNFWAFRHAIEIVRGKYDNPSETGEVTHFQALASALSATVGLGNIAGVTIAMTLGGPGAFFWMMLCGLFGMSSKFVECTLGQKYRRVNPDGTVLGGPMQYLHAGLKELGLGGLGLVLSIIFAVMCILASFGGGNMFQANQSGEQVLTMIQRGGQQEIQALDDEIRQIADSDSTEGLSELQERRKGLVASQQQFAKIFKPIYGLVLAFFVAIVIIGGIKRIGAAAEKVVPAMCLMYMMACLWIIAVHVTEVPALVATIFSEAMSPKAFGGGMLGVLVIGVQRAAFSNEAGVGSASIAHSAARTEEPVREGTVALLGPFIDTVVVCSMTALVVLITGAWQNESWIVDEGLAGAPLTSRAFETEISWFPYLLTVAVVLFAYSTLISWSYYGERCWERLFGRRSTLLYKFIYVSAAFVGSIVNLGAVLDFSDMMILSMAFPNIFGLLLLSPKVRRDMLSYWQRYKNGEFKTYK